MAEHLCCGLTRIVMGGVGPTCLSFQPMLEGGRLAWQYCSAGYRLKLRKVLFFSLVVLDRALIASSIV